VKHSTGLLVGLLGYSPVDCLVTSNGYGLSVNYNTGQTTLAPGSPCARPERELSLGVADTV
jgi:hypothetical protein